MGTSANIQLAEQWISLLKASQYKYGIYANGNQWSGMFGTQSQSIGSSDLPFWAVQDDGVSGVGTVTTFCGGWTSAYGKQYDLSKSPWYQRLHLTCSNVVNQVLPSAAVVSTPTSALSVDKVVFIKAAMAEASNTRMMIVP